MMSIFRRKTRPPEDASERTKHAAALRYFLRRRTTIGMHDGELSLLEVIRAISYFAYEEETA